MIFIIVLLVILVALAPTGRDTSAYEEYCRLECSNDRNSCCRAR